MPRNSVPQPTPADGTIDETDGRYVLRFERYFHHPIERVWDALTRPERIRQWIGEAEVELDLVEGGKLKTRTTGPPELIEAIIAEHGDDVDLVAHDTILRVEAPVLFEHTFGGDPGSIARWELQREGDGCRLLLTHTEPPGFAPADAPRDLSGWHTLLELLGHALDGAPVPWRKDRWEEHRDRYAAKVGPT
jgi:uncharacterized protein YndB with AHSA1/START domain